MSVSIFDLFTVGIGPSSSHTVGPMKAAKSFLEVVESQKLFEEINTIKVELYGSLALTGKGHGTHKAILLGLSGYSPESIDPEIIPEVLSNIQNKAEINLLNKRPTFFIEKDSVIYKRKEVLPYHSNGMKFLVFNQKDELLFSKEYYSIGGGFIVDDTSAKDDKIDTHKEDIPYPYDSFTEFMNKGIEKKLSISEMVLENEKTWFSEEEIFSQLDEIWEVMKGVVKRGCEQEGILPGGLKVQRRAPELYQKLLKEDKDQNDPLSVMDWVNLYALAVNEENASGGRIVTAPTNGAAGIIPAVLYYFAEFCPEASKENFRTFLLTAGGIGVFYKLHASISGAEVGCQGEVGVACSMAAGALTEVRGGNIMQVENAAEIGMEHNLGLTCDPIGGLVQIPCIERNAMGSVKAINAARIALKGDGTHFVSLDKVIKTMKRTGDDMKVQYKETSTGGLAVNITEC